jgi:hypothetical protein
LHDDELSSVFSFLELEQLARLVRCNRRFHTVARKERCRGLHLEGDASVVPHPSSVLNHHIASFHLEHKFNKDARITRAMLRELRCFPHLTVLRLTLSKDDGVNHLMQEFSPEIAAAELQVVLPTHLRSFGITLGSLGQLLDAPSAVFASSFWAALGNMTQLTELSIKQYSEHMHVRPELAQLSHLRKLTLGPAGQRGEYTDALKQLSQLRELSLYDRHPAAERIRLLCQPPHSLQLEYIALPALLVDVDTMRALLHLPTLTALDPGSIHHDALSLLPQFPLLRRLRFSPCGPLSPHLLSLLCDALFGCKALVELTFIGGDGYTANGNYFTAEQIRANWTALFSSVPNLRRLSVHVNVTGFLSVLSLHLPLLAHLALSGWYQSDENPYASVAHPNIRLLEFGLINGGPPSDEQLRACMHRERLPKLERCIFRADCVA